MSMQLALRPYVTAGIALVGASVIAVSPIVPSHSEVHLPAVNLTASIDNPFQVFAPVVDAAGNWIAGTIQSELSNPFPILQQIATNQITTAAGVLEAVRGGAAGVGEIVGGLPAALGAAGAKLAVGDVNGAIDAIMAAGLNPFINLIMGVWTPLQPVLERPFLVGQALVPAVFDAALSLTVGIVLSTVGIGFDTGTTPFIQQIVKSTQAVLDAVTTLNPINVLNAIQHGIADVALNFVTQLDAFTTGTIPYIREVLVKALQAGSPVSQTAAISAPEVTSTEATKPEVTTPTTDTGDATLVKDVVDEGGSTVAGPVEEGTTVDVTVPETVSTPVVTTETPVKEVKVETSPEDTDVTVATGSTTVTRDSLKAEPGETGLTSGTDSGTGTGSGSTTATESTGNTTVSESTDTSSTPSSSTGTSADSDSDSGSDSDSSAND